MEKTNKREQGSEKGGENEGRFGLDTERGKELHLSLLIAHLHQKLRNSHQVGDNIDYLYFFILLHI